MGVDAHATVAATQASTVAGLARGLDVELEPMTLEQTGYVIVDGVDGTLVDDEPVGYVDAVRTAAASASGPCPRTSGSPA